MRPNIKTITFEPIFMPQGEMNDKGKWENAYMGVHIYFMLDDGTYKSLPVVWTYNDFGGEAGAFVAKSLFENALNMMNFIREPQNDPKPDANPIDPKP